jgi:hypothetical protein
VKVITQTVGRDHEEHLVLLSISLIDTPVSDLCSVCLEFVFYRSNVRHKDGRTILRRIATVYGETDAGPVTLEDHRWDWLITPFNFRQAEMLGIPLRGRIEIRDWQRQDIVLEGVRFFEPGFALLPVRRSLRSPKHTREQDSRDWKQNHVPDDSNVPHVHVGQWDAGQTDECKRSASV